MVLKGGQEIEGILEWVRVEKEDGEMLESEKNNKTRGVYIESGEISLTSREICVCLGRIFFCLIRTYQYLLMLKGSFIF